MRSLMDLNALGFLSTPYRLRFSSGGGSFGFKFSPNSESDSCGIIILTNLPSEFLNHYNIISYMKNKETPKRNKNNYTKRINVR